MLRQTGTDRRRVALGNRELTRIGLGTNRLTQSESSGAFLRAAVAAGLNFIDTAHLYTGGESEQAIGAALSPSHDVVVATKGGYYPRGLDALRHELETSLERLRTECIALYYLHRVHEDPSLEDALELVAGYRERGRIEHVGLSEVTVEQIERARRIVPIAAVQNEFNIGVRHDDDVVDYCAAEGILFVPFYPLGGAAPGALGEIAARRGATASQIRLAWLLHRSPTVVPIPGTLSLAHLEENRGALDIELSNEELDALTS